MSKVELPYRIYLNLLSKHALVKVILWEICHLVIVVLFTVVIILISVGIAARGAIQ